MRSHNCRIFEYGKKSQGNGKKSQANGQKKTEKKLTAKRLKEVAKSTAQTEVQFKSATTSSRAEKIENSNLERERPLLTHLTY